MPAPPLVDIETLDVLTQDIARLLYTQALMDEADGEPLRGLNVQEIARAFHKREASRLKKRLQNLQRLDLVQIREETGQKRYAFDLYPLRHYGNRPDIADLAALLEQDT